MKSSLKLAALSAAILSAPMSSLAATETDTFQVTIELLASCSIESTENIGFGPQSEADINAGNVGDQTGDIVVNCTNGASYTLGLSGNGAMTSANGSSVSYNLLNDATSTPWDNSGNLVSSSGTGADQTHTVRAEIPAQTATIGAGDTPGGDAGNGVVLSDTVSVTLTY